MLWLDIEESLLLICGRKGAWDGRRDDRKGSEEMIWDTESIVNQVWNDKSVSGTDAL